MTAQGTGRSLDLRLSLVANRARFFSLPCQDDGWGVGEVLKLAENVKTGQIIGPVVKNISPLFTIPYCVFTGSGQAETLFLVSTLHV